MRKKIATMVLAAAMVLSQTVCVLAAGSTTTSPVIADGSGQSGSLTSSTSAGNDTVHIGIGQQSAVSGESAAVQTNERGEAVVGDTALSFVQGSDHAVIGLPESVVNSIQGINSGLPLENLITDVDLAGYNALIGTHAIMTKAAATGAEKTGNVEFPLYVPNLIDGLGDVEVLFYDNSIGRWVMITPDRIDTASKTVWMTIPGSGTLSVIYRR
ncbi:MAG: hypothetical protein ACI4F1_06615 [Bariatricus sp.]